MIRHLLHHQSEVQAFQLVRARAGRQSRELSGSGRGDGDDPPQVRVKERIRGAVHRHPRDGALVGGGELQWSVEKREVLERALRQRDDDQFLVRIWRKVRRVHSKLFDGYLPVFIRKID